MINLLPQKEKYDFSLRKTNNLILVFGGVIIIFLICLILVLLSVKFYMLTEIDYQKFLLEDTKSYNQSPATKKIRSAIQNYNSIMPSVVSFYKKQVSFSDILGTISRTYKPSGLYFSNIYLKQSSDRKITANILGINNTRENLLSFQKSLEELKENKMIDNIYFSPDSWINQTDSSFNLTFEITAK